MSAISTALPNEGGIAVSLFDINNKWIKNYRRDAFDHKLNALRKSINEGTVKDGGLWRLGVMMSLIGCWSKDKTYVNLAGGFCRLEACHQIALKEVIDDYNKHFGYKEGDEGFVYVSGNPKSDESPDTLSREKHRLKVRDQGGEWAEKYDAALKSHTLLFNLKDWGDPDTDEAKRKGLLANFDENRNRTDPSLWDSIERVVELSAMGYKGSEIQATLDLSAAAVSQYKTLHAMPEEMRAHFSGDAFEKEYPNVEDRALALATLTTCLSEFIARLKLPPADPKCIDFSKAREVVYAIKPDGKKQVKMKDRLRLLRLLTRVGDDGKATDIATTDLSTINTEIRAAQNFAKEKVAEATPEQINASVDAAAAAAAAAVSAGKVEAPATVAQQAPAASAATPATATPASPAPVQTNVPQAGPSTTQPNAAIEAEIAAANNGVVADRLPVDVPPAELEESLSLDDILDGDLSIGDDHLAAAEQALAEAKSNAGESLGQMASKMQDVKVDKYANKVAPETLERWAIDDLKNVTRNENSTIFTAAIALANATTLLNAIGNSRDRDVINKQSLEFLAACESYHAKLEEIVGAKATMEEKAELMAMRPKYELPAIAK